MRLSYEKLKNIISEQMSDQELDDAEDSGGGDDSDELVDQILQTEYTDEQVAAIGSVIESCSYTTTALAAFAAFLAGEYDDYEGSSMILSFCKKFAEHEAKRI